MADLTTFSVTVIALGTFVVSLLVSAFGPTGGLQLAIVAAIVPPPLTIPIHAWISAVSALLRAVNLRRQIEWHFFLLFSVATLAGSGLGIMLVREISSRILEVVVGVSIVASALRVTANKRSHSVHAGSSPVVVGLATGFLTIFVGATGPLLFTLMAKRFQERVALMATHSACITLQHLSKLIAFGTIGVVMLEHPGLLLATACASALGTAVGSRLLLRISEATFRKTLTPLMLVSGVFVIVRAALSR
ncbi:MAG: sulfite exporter TauE/SafE family protein [Pseudomonadota bacterium]